MPVVFCLNPGSNSLKFDLVDTNEAQTSADQGDRLATGAIENVGKDASLQIHRGSEEIVSEKIDASDLAQASTHAMDALRKTDLPQASLGVVRVVHGGDDFDGAAEITEEVLRKVEARSELAPLHNPNAVTIARTLQKQRQDLRLFAAFDTAFHRTIPEVAWRYPIDRERADRLAIRKFGFHGISHRYQLERYCSLTGRAKETATVITSHLESGSSVCAIRKGQSVETSMGFTPLEGLMMGTRSGSVDAAIVPFLMKHDKLSVDEALDVLEKKSGLLGISGQSLDTRILRTRTDAHSKLAMEMYAYRVRATFGAYLAILGDAEAIVFSGGIGENTPEVRKAVLDGLGGWGVRYDAEKNATSMSGDVRLSLPESTLDVWAMHADEGLQLAHEALLASRN